MIGSIKIYLMVVAFLSLFGVSFDVFSAPYIPNHIEAQIKESAAIEYPNSYSMQVYTIKRERDAYINLQTYNPEDIFYTILDKIKEMASEAYPDKYALQLSAVQRQVDAYRQIEKFKVNDILWGEFLNIKARAQDKYPANYSTQLYEIKREVEAYLKLRR